MVDIAGAGANAGAVLAELAERARRSYADSVNAWVATAYVLAEARVIAPHGQWGAFLAEAGIPERTARNMLRVARAGVKTATVADLGGIKATLGLLTRDPQTVKEIAAVRADIDALRGELARETELRTEAEAETGRLRSRHAEAVRQCAELEGRMTCHS